MSGSVKLTNILPPDDTGKGEDGKPTVHASGIEELINWHHKQASELLNPPTPPLPPYVIVFVSFLTDPATMLPAPALPQKAVENVKLNRVLLCFQDTKLELDFEIHYFNLAKKRSQIACLCLLAITALLGIADFAYHAEKGYDSILSLGTLVIIRYGALLPLGLLLLVLSNTRSFQHYSQYAIAIFNFVFGSGLSAMAVLGGDYAGYGTVFTFVFYTFFLSKVGN